MRLQLKKSKTYKDHTGSLIPFYKNDSFKKFDVKRFFLCMGIKNILELIMLIKNVIKYLFLYQEKLRFKLQQKKVQRKDLICLTN